MVLAEPLEEPERGSPEGEGNTDQRNCQPGGEGGADPLSLLTCIGETQNFWLFRLLRLWDVWDQRLFFSDMGDLV